MSQTQTPPSDSFDPQEVDPENSSPTFHCRLCDFNDSSRKSVARHINRSSDADHRDRSASEDPSLIEIEGNDLLKEWNERTDFEGDEGTIYDDLDYKILFEIWCSPNATQGKIADKIGVSTTTVANRISDLGVKWRDRMELVEDLFPTTKASEAGYSREELADTESEESDDEQDEDEEEEMITVGFGNREYAGPATGLNLAEGSDAGANPGTREDAKLRLESFESLSSKQQAVVIGLTLHADDATKSSVAKTAGVDPSYLTPSSLPRHVKSIQEALGSHFDNGVVTVGDFLARFKDEQEHEHDLDRVVEHVDSETEPRFPPSDDSDSADGSDDSEGENPDVLLGLTHDEVYELLTNSDASDEILRQLYDAVAESN